jgi:hypothetical protein
MPWRRKGDGGTNPPVLTAALDVDEWSASRPTRIFPGKRASGTHWIGGWVCPRADLDAMEKRTSAVQSAVRRYVGFLNVYYS